MKKLKNEDTKTPQLRVCVTNKCNLNCLFCRPGGEGYGENLDEKLSLDELKTLVSTCRTVGFECIKFTGGEPLLREDIVDLVRYAKQLKFSDIQMVTNGIFLKNKVVELKDAGIDMITISLDAIDAEVYKSVRGGDIKPIIEAIYKCKEIGLPVRINMVVVKSNYNQVKPMIEFTSKTNSSLKLLDLIHLPGIESFSYGEYLDFKEIRLLLQEIGAKFIGKEEAPGGIGAPLSEYRLSDNTQIVIKDSTQGTFYHETCKLCRNYPCQDALISVRVTHDGHLKRCLIRNDNLVNVLPSIRNGKTEETFRAIQKVFEIMVNSKFESFRWKPPIEIKGEV